MPASHVFKLAFRHHSLHVLTASTSIRALRSGQSLQYATIRATAAGTGADPVQHRVQEPSNRDIASCLKVAQQLQRQSYGQYNPDELFLNHQDKSPPKLANFTGPLKVTHLPGGPCQVATPNRPGAVPEQ